MEKEEDFQSATKQPPARKDNRLLSIVCIIVFATGATCVGSVFKFASQAGVTVGDFAIMRTAMMFVCLQPVRMAF
jgi:hypothetical protein